MERTIERILFASRWLMAPFYLGLILALLLPLFAFGRELLHLLFELHSRTETEVILAVLTLVDLTLVANLILIVILSGYENFVSKIEVENHRDRPDWLGKVDFSGLKLKLISSIVAISGIHVLKAFMTVESIEPFRLWGLVGVHLVFVVSGVLLALMDLLAERAHTEKLSHKQTPG